MMTQIAKSVLLLSVCGGVLGLVLLLIKPITKRFFSPSWQFYIWLVVLVILVFPVSFSLPAKVPDAQAVTQTAQNTVIDDALKRNTENTVPAAEAQETPVRRQTNPAKAAWLVFAALWLLGAIGTFLYKIIHYALFVRAVNQNSFPDCGKTVADVIENLPPALSVRWTELLDAPLVIGVFCPVLFLPENVCGKEDLRYILLHELTHVRRRDLLYKWFAALVCSVHWFNPVVYAVSKQIEEECEVSCDYCVAQNLSAQEQIDYMRMILNMLTNAKLKARPLTTQMAGSKKTLKRRFEMMKNRKKKSRLTAAVSVFVAAVMLSATAFASGLLQNTVNADYRIDFLMNGAKMNLTNEPFMKNGEVYLPLRETFEKAGIFQQEESYISWNEGKIALCVAIDVPATITGADGGREELTTFLYRYGLEIGLPQLLLNPETESAKTEKKMENAPILKDSVAYVPFSYIDYMFSHQMGDLGYIAYNKNGAVVESISVPSKSDGETVVYNGTNFKNPSSVMNSFFEAFAVSDFEAMKLFCTQNCIDKYFRYLDGGPYLANVYDMTKASVVSMNIPFSTGAASAEKRIQVTVECERPAHSSVWGGRRSFQVVLEKQQDGTYRIHEFETVNENKKAAN